MGRQTYAIPVEDFLGLFEAGTELIDVAMDHGEGTVKVTVSGPMFSFWQVGLPPRSFMANIEGRIYE